MNPPRTVRPCSWCGQRTGAPNAVCMSCVWLDANLRKPVTEASALPPGRWEYDPRRRVQVYVEDPDGYLTRPRCGTDSGYYAHRWRKERTCWPCRTAHAAAERERVST